MKYKGLTLMVLMALFFAPRVFSQEFTAGVKDDGFTGTELPEFIQFSIKIVLTSTNAAQAPRVKDLRAIALAY